MTKTLLALFIMLSLTACHERQGPKPKTSKLTEKPFIRSQTNTETEKLSIKEKGVKILP